MALPRPARLPRLRITEHGVRRQFAFGSLKMLPPPVGAAVVVSKRVFKTAPLRNRARRRVAEAVRGLIARGALRSAVVIYPAASVLRVTGKEVAEALSRALLQARA